MVRCRTKTLICSKFPSQLRLIGVLTGDAVTSIGRIMLEQYPFQSYALIRLSIRKAKKAARAKSYREVHSEHLSAYFKARHAADPTVNRKRASAHYIANRQRAKDRLNERYATDPKYRAEKRVYAEEYAKNNQASIRANSRKYRGLPDPTRPEPIACECCGNSSGGRGMALDHCHVTGAFRGWLCVKCNSGIGILGDTVEAAERAVAYLKRAYQ